MAYTPPAGDNVNFTITGSYTPPSGDEVNFSFGFSVATKIFGVESANTGEVVQTPIDQIASIIGVS